MLDTARQIVATLFDVPLESISAETSPATLPKWDSMGQLMLIMQLEQELGLRISPEDGEKLTSVRAIADTLARAR